MTPHHHLVIGTVEGQVRCHGRNVDMRKYRARFDNCACLSHRFARPWKEVTGDSYMVFATEVVGAAGAGGYMGKYLDKTFGMEDRLRAVGMQRRWSSSRGWPGSGRLRLAQSSRGGGTLRVDGTESGWSHREYLEGHLSEEVMGGPEWLMEREGNSVAVALAKKRSEAGRIGWMERRVRDV